MTRVKRASQRDFDQLLGGAGSKCPSCGKYRYLSKATAKRAIRGMKGRTGRLNAYRCPVDPDTFWHLGHVPPDLTAGRVARGDIKPKRVQP